MAGGEFLLWRIIISVSYTHLSDMRYMLLHELQHYKHKDAVASYLMNLAGVVSVSYTHLNGSLTAYDSSSTELSNVHLKSPPFMRPAYFTTVSFASSADCTLYL